MLSAILWKRKINLKWESPHSFLSGNGAVTSYPYKFLNIFDLIFYYDVFIEIFL